MRRDSRRSIHCSGSKSFTSAAIRVFSFPGSNRVRGPTPDFPATAPAHVDSTPMPKGVTSPRPVTTTLRRDMLVESGIQVEEPVSAWRCSAAHSMHGADERFVTVWGPSMHGLGLGDSLVTIELGHEPTSRPDHPAVPDGLQGPV